MSESFAQHIVVATDFSKASERAVAAAAVLARQNEAKCTLVHVFDPEAFAPRAGAYQLHSESMTVEPEVEQAIHEELRRVAEERLKDAPTVKTALVLARNAANGIVDYAKKEDADLIVIATHGRSGLSHFLIGSVAEKVVRHAPCPVLSLRPAVDE
jgi:nucleotide-binding universal stress UspA family protein